MPCQIRRFFIIKIYSRRNLHEEKKIRKEAAELFAHAGDGRRSDAGDGVDGVCGVNHRNMESERHSSRTSGG